MDVRTAYRCRAYPDPAQQAVLNRTFGCVRVVWNRTLASRQERYAAGRTATSYAQTDRALTVMKRDPGLAFLAEVSSVPLQQALRHQHQAFGAFFAKRSRCPRFKSRHSRQCAHYTRSAFSMRGGVLRLAKNTNPLRFVWSWPDVDIAALNPTMVTASREPDGRWYVTFAVDASAAQPLAATRRDFLHRASTRLVRGNDVIVIEDLAVKNMVRNRHLARVISDCGWGEFRRQLEYKCER
jgi:putative transposase